MGMLKEQDIFVRSHLSPLKPEQVSLMRARWEREKRKLKEAPAAPKRRRAVKAAEPVAVVPEARPKRRRRTAAEVAAAEAEAQAEAAVEAERELKAREALEAAKVVEEEKPSLEERAAALFKDLPVAVEAAGEPQAATPFAASATASSVAPAAPPPPPPPPPEARDPDTRAAQAGGERHARRSGAAAPSPAGRLRRPGRHPARGAPPREGEETQEGQEVARGPGGRRAEHLPHPRVHQGPGRPQGRAPAGGGPELPRPGGAEAA